LTKAIADAMNKAALTKLRLFLLHFQQFICGVVWTWQFAVECLKMLLSVYQATAYASQHYSKPVEIGRVAAERAFGVIMGNDGGGAPIVWMGLHPGRLSVCLPLQHNIHKWTSIDGGS